MELTYRRIGDYDLPELELEQSPKVGRYGRMRHDYLRSCRRPIYTGMMIAGTLNSHLEQIDRQAEEMTELLIGQMTKAEAVTERLKATDQMAWVTAMNSIRSRAEEIVLAELIYA